ncbi:serine/threonine-protein kinase [Streptomyces sp. NPDC058045]|uniref:serine/threonine-protein kinase n=1 Tax=Streptomyces sp. NPDC058045 TaxID=3346311 RepID=UPI0036EA1992
MTNPGGQPYEPTSYELRPPQAPSHPPQAPAGPPVPPQQTVPYQQADAYQPTQAASVPPDEGQGRVLGGRYQLLSRLGHGGMGTVWRARDLVVEREVAVKEPRLPDQLGDAERQTAYERMQREARAAARIDHPSVVTMHDVVVEGGKPWVVMELVHGQSLADRLREGTLDPREAARVGLAVLGALTAAHEAGVLHRDVKPDNVLLGRGERVVLTDFGIAQVEGEQGLTETGGFVGSPEFIAPERVLGRRPGPASDLWSLGVVLYVAAEGVSPFRRSNSPATLQSVLNSTPAAPAAAQGPLADAINGLLAKDPAQRPDAARVRALLEEAARPPQPTRVVRVAGPGGGGVRIGRKTLLVTAAVVAAAVAVGVLVVTDPFSGPLPDDWSEHHLGGKIGATLPAPSGFERVKPEEATDGTTESYEDPSGLVSITLNVARKAEDQDGHIQDTASAQAFADWREWKDGDYTTHIEEKPAPEGEPKETQFDGHEAAENTVLYTSSKDLNHPRVREARVLYYRNSKGDMYRLWVDYPGKGEFAAEGREMARTAVANLKIDAM